MQDPAAAPDGETLFQLQMPIKKDESRAGAARRVEALADLAVPGWRERTTWRRSGSARHRGGALDLPGLTWRDRPAVDRGDGVFLAGDMVAAPGMRGEISVASALRAMRRRPARPPPHRARHPVSPAAARPPGVAPTGR